MSSIQTPTGERRHIVLVGGTNAGKSCLLNALTGSAAALVSPVPGTTTDPVCKPFEWPQIGASLLIDTAGLGDQSELSGQRLEKTQQALRRADAFLWVARKRPQAEELAYIQALRKRHLPGLCVVNAENLPQDPPDRKSVGNQEALGVAEMARQMGLRCVWVNAATGLGIAELLAALPDVLEQEQPRSLTAHLAKPLQVALLVMPQDPQAPKGRLILPQVQTIRDLLEQEMLVLCTTLVAYPSALAALQAPPALIITDSSVFRKVRELAPLSSALTSFSVLFARYKGDLERFQAGARHLLELSSHSRVLIAEACSHAPQNEDIGRVKLPNLLRRRIGSNLQIEVVAGQDFPDDLSPYDAIIHCGACMFTRAHVLSRIEAAQRFAVPITNYGLAIAALEGLTDELRL